VSGERRPAKRDGEIKVLVRNRKARHDYHIDEDFEAGMVLMGSEVKSLRDSRASITDAYGVVKNGEVFLENAQIEPYPQANAFNHEPFRTRKLLMNKLEIRRLRGKLEEKGYTLIPLEIYVKNGRIKVQLGLAKGKKQWDKREATRERDVRREMDQAAASARKR
jgi:SsrA-binding protein